MSRTTPDQKAHERPWKELTYEERRAIWRVELAKGPTCRSCRAARPVTLTGQCAYCANRYW